MTSRRTVRLNSPARFEHRVSMASTSGSRTHERLRKELKYFFMNPCQKYKYRKRKPFKLTIQIFKITFVTIQLIIFGQHNQDRVAFMDDNLEVFRHNLMNNVSRLYEKNEVYSKVNYLRQQYVKLKNSSVGIYGYLQMGPTINCPMAKPTSNRSNNPHKVSSKHDTSPPPVYMCVDQYTDYQIENETFQFNPKSRNKTCMFLRKWNKNELTVDFNQSVPLCNGSSYSIDFHGLINLDLKFGVRTIWLKNPASYYQADCYNVSISVNFNNQRHNGIIIEAISSQFGLTPCHSATPAKIFDSFLLFLDCFIIVTCCASMILCTRSVWRAQRLRKSFERYYKKHHEKRLSWWTKLEFVNGWYLLIIISDILTITGSIIKMALQMQWYGTVNYDSCSLFLGVGCLCVWVGVLRYVGYFHQYNILVLTLKNAMPHVLRFMVCASLLYLGYMFCGWVVLGPYHHKFRNPVVTSEALFSLINGDDMYMTFEEMAKTSNLAWVFSQVYLYTFIALFIYVVLSLFIAVIMETYETIQEWQKEGFPPQSEIQKFISEGLEEDIEFNYNSDTYCCCCLYRNNDPDISTDDEQSECENTDDDILIIT
uniref:mucolipin-3 n=1 Tax=Ciona intestinalis TaxID=7719 RepID=UPI000180BB24|nr:mucolipin-3 [Ciona intestinalis]|eukprot:XP_002129787.1 mucolipin-3 [Ciona intestinalis]